MRPFGLTTSLRVLTWSCIVLLAVLSLVPEQMLVALSLSPALTLVRTLLPGPVEHFVAYAGVTAIAMAAYGPSRGGVGIIGGLSVYAGMLECIRHLSPGRHPSIGKFAGSALGAVCVGLVILLLWRRYLRYQQQGFVNPVR
jgi:VanZ family protein